MKIFLSYGHDANELLVEQIRKDLEARGHEVWIGRREITFNDDWRREITEGILSSQRLLAFLSEHSTREPGVCQQEIAIALNAGHVLVTTVLVEDEGRVTPPSLASHLQWLDMRDWKARQESEEPPPWEEYYRYKLDEIVRVLEGGPNEHFSGEIEQLRRYADRDRRPTQCLEDTGQTLKAWRESAPPPYRMSCCRVTGKNLTVSWQEAVWVSIRKPASNSVRIVWKDRSGLPESKMDVMEETERLMAIIAIKQQRPRRSATFQNKF